jgi:Zn-dependent peptidase ImmA (M78 family)/transcriptional regulator with XRE-family HTH domain
LGTLGRRLREARQNSGISQEAAAETIGVPRTAIAHIEAGNRSISTIELVELANLYKRPVADFFAEDGGREEDPVFALHRISQDYLGHPETAGEVARWVDICREGYEIARLLSRKARTGPPSYELSAPQNYGAAVEQGQAVAAEERRRLGLGQARISDMADLVSGQGIWASGARLPDEMSGMFLHHPSVGMVILVNYNHARGRKRFSYAHEYGHALMDRRRSVTVTTKKNANEFIEKRANAFAAAFLLPKVGVDTFLQMLDKGAPSRQVYHVYDVATEGGIEAQRRPVPGSQEITYQDVAELALHFGASYQVAAYRLSDLGFINRQELQVLLSKQAPAHHYLRVLGRLDEVNGEPRPSDRELTRQVVPLAVEAFRREAIPRERLLDLGERLGIPGEDLVRLATDAS